MICKSCDRELDYKTLKGMRYCPYCTATLTEETEQLSAETFKTAVERLHRKVQEEFDIYKDELEALHIKFTQSRNILKRLSAPNIISRDACHLEYMNEVARQIDSVAELLAQCPDDEESRSLAGEFAYDIARFFLTAKGLIEDVGKWTMVACEHRTTVLFPYISLEGMRELYELFCVQTPNRASLPNERQLKKDMETLIKELDE